MKVLGLTGSIGMGKTTASGLLRHLGCGIHDADACVHRLMAPSGAAVPAVESAFPGVVDPSTGAVDRAELGKRVFGKSDALRTLEHILHPKVATDRNMFLIGEKALGRKFAVLDVPLLFETGGEARCDATIVVTAPAPIQELRVLARPGMTRQRLLDIRARQMPEAEKRARADFIVWSSLGKGTTLRQLSNILKILSS